jgi:hypothetical protein
MSGRGRQMAVKRFSQGTYIVSCVGSDFLNFRGGFENFFICLYSVDNTPFPPYFLISYDNSFELEYNDGSSFEYQLISQSDGFRFQVLYPSGAELNSVVGNLINVFDRLGSLDTRLSQIKTNTDRLP